MKIVPKFMKGVQGRVEEFGGDSEGERFEIRSQKGVTVC